MLELCLLLAALASPDGEMATNFDESNATRSDDLTADAAPAEDGSWGCIVGFLGDEDAAYCLANCEGFAPDGGRPAYRSKVRLGDVPDDWCAKKARRYCHRRGLELNYSCWGDYFTW